MNSDLKNKVAKYYGEKIAAFGAVAKGVDWKDETSQNLRFAQLLKLVEDKQGFSLNDLGCGYGALYLFQNTSARLKSYAGYDIASGMLEKARRFINDGKAQFIMSDKLTQVAEFSVASGIYNVKLDTAREVWEDFVKDSLANLNEYSTHGFAFNCMTSYVDFQVPHLYYADPCYYFEYCIRNFSRFVTLIHDYPLYEWTILVRKQP